MKARPYQSELITAARDVLVPAEPAVIVAPTGSGKTGIAAMMSYDFVHDEGLTVLFCCHRGELVDQTVKTFRKVGLRPGYIASGYPEPNGSPVNVAMIQTLVRRLDRTPVPDVVFIDEAHGARAKTWAKVVEWAVKGGAIVIGLTATPRRFDGRGLGALFDHLVQGPTERDLIAQGWLSKYVINGCDELPNMKGVRKVAGDFATGGAFRAMDQPRIYGSIVDNWAKHARGMRTIGFAQCIEHSKRLVTKCQADGIRAAHIDGETPRAERRRLLRDFARGRLQIVWNVSLFGEGFDVAANSGIDCTVESVVMARKTLSLSLYRQMAGRCLRPKDDGAAAVINDHVGHWHEHGPPDLPIEWSLEGEPEKGDDDEPAMRLKQCPKCFRIDPATAVVCSNCGKSYETKRRSPRAFDEQDGTLVRLDGSVMNEVEARLLKAEKRRRLRGAKSFEDLVKYAKDTGQDEPQAWALRVIANRKKRSGRTTAWRKVGARA